MTSTAAEKTGHSGEKEKAEKRRALGRGLESLLPGPRVVAAARTAGTPAASVGGDTATAEPHGAAAVSASVLPQPESGVVKMSDEAAELRSAWPDQRSGPTQSSESITIFAQAESRIPGNLVVNLAIENIDKNPFQTRYVESDDALEELTNSIKANGVLQPILVRPAEEEGRYILILGERRLHATKLAGKTAIPAMVRRVSDQQAAEMTIIENLQREDLSPLEQAEAFRVLSEEFKLTQAQIGERVGLSRESVSNYMRLLRLPREVMQLLAEKKIKFAEAKELLKLESNDKITQAALYAVKKGMTVEQVERLVLRMNGWLDSFPGMPGQPRKKSGARWVDPNVREAQFELERLLGVRVKIRDRKGKGKIVIEYSTVDDYDRVVGMLRGKK
ncbi:MAG: ParB/RepB/Spo0J family partition protein [Candidatus Sulfotelmatobacter sp.]